MPRRMRAARELESVPRTPPATRSRRSPCRRLNARVRSATKSSRLSGSRRSTSAPASGSMVGSRSLRQAARAQWGGRPTHRFCGRCRLRAPAPAPKAWAPRPPPTRQPLLTSGPDADRGRQRSPPPNDARGTVWLRALESPQSGAVVQEGSTLDELAEDFVHRRDGYPVALWGSTPISAFMRATQGRLVASCAPFLQTGATQV
jgi:hypothetical protein